jgi:altronate hydrolase
VEYFVSASVLRIHPADNVAVALKAVSQGQSAAGVVATGDIPAGHKMALCAIAPGEAVIKYGYQIGSAKRQIAAGEHVHVDNMASALKGNLERGGYVATTPWPEPAQGEVTFAGYRRANGKIGIRNEIWILPTVGCVNHAAARIAERAHRELAVEGSGIDGVYSFPHPFGCSQLGDDLANTRKLLAGIAKHPNAAGVLVLGLGCENNQLAAMVQQLAGEDPERLRWFNAQEADDEVETGVERVRELAAYASRFHREPIAARELVLGLKCGGSDGLSGITANPLVGRIADKLAAVGGTSILTEVPEIFGAEKVLLDRAVDAEVYDATIDLVNEFRDYFRQHNEPIDENPSPGNKDGGITTLAEKSLGCVQKGGSSPIRQVVAYGDQVQPQRGGIALLNGPGNDGVSGTALSAAGAHMVLFTTGRGNPLGFPVPVIKIATNSPLAGHKRNWIDFNAGPVAEGTATLDELAEALFRQVLDVASGKLRTQNEINGYREISIWKDGVTL